MPIIPKPSILAPCGLVNGKLEKQDANDLYQYEPTEPPQLIEGVLHIGGKVSLGAPSKSFTSWTLINLGISIAFGVPWIGLKTTRHRILFLNFELKPWSFGKRYRRIREALGIQHESGWFDVVHLRGYTEGHKKLSDLIIDQYKNEKYGMIIADPLYKLYDRGADENIVGLTEVLKSLESISEGTGAAIAYRHHYSKGNQSNKNVLDRVSGSGVLARDPDSLINLTPQKEEGSFTVDFTLRDLPVHPSFVVQWEHPMLRVKDGGDPKAIAKTTRGRPAKHTEQTLLAALKDGMSTTEWKIAANLTSKSRFDQLKGSLTDSDIVDVRDHKWYHKIKPSTNGKLSSKTHNLILGLNGALEGRKPDAP